MRLLLAMLVAFACVAPASACKYSVRDVGFVSPGERVTLALVHDGSVPADMLKQAEESLRRALRDSNVLLRVVAASDATLADHSEVRKSSGLTFWLIAPERAIRPLQLPANLSAKELRALIESPLLQRIRAASLERFAVLLLIEGTNESANAKAKEKAALVVTQIDKVLPRLEKPTPQGPELIVVPLAERGALDLVRWSVGDHDTAEPKLVVVYGQLRRTRHVFAGAAWELPDLFTVLVTLGQSCECDLDRRQYFGPVLPHVWPAESQQRVADLLKFDPASASVRSEIEAILQKSPQPEGERKTRRISFEEVMSGYRERSIDDDDDPPPVKSAPAPVVETKLQEIVIGTKAETQPASTMWVWLVGGAAAVLFALGLFLRAR
jgi:hypothetical protein